MRLRFTPLALAEIDRVFGELAARSSQGARSVRLRLRDVTKSVREYPHLGQITDTRLVRRIGLHPYPYILFYRVIANEIVVVGLRHAARDPAAMPGATMLDDLP